MKLVTTVKTDSSENTGGHHFPSKPRTTPQPHAIDQGSSGAINRPLRHSGPPAHPPKLQPYAFRLAQNRASRATPFWIISSLVA